MLSLVACPFLFLFAHSWCHPRFGQRNFNYFVWLTFTVCVDIALVWEQRVSIPSRLRPRFHFLAGQMPHIAHPRYIIPSFFPSILILLLLLLSSSFRPHPLHQLRLTRLYSNLHSLKIHPHLFPIRHVIKRLCIPRQ